MRFNIIISITTLTLIAVLSACSSGSSNQKPNLSASSPSGNLSPSLKCRSLTSAPTLKSGNTVTRIEGEHYDTCAQSYSDTTAGNIGNALRSDDVDIGMAEDASQRHYIQSFTGAGGEYVEFSVNVASAGFYSIVVRMRAESESSNQDIELRLINPANTTTEGLASLGADVTTWTDVIIRPQYLTDGPQVLRLAAQSGTASIDYIEISYDDLSSASSADIIGAMGIGINLGNTLDAYPNEGDWAPIAKQQYFIDFKSAGFKHVRIPVTWDTHVANTAPFAIDELYLNRVEQVVDWALAEGLYVILNAHHEIWLKENYDNPVYRARFDAIWQQISKRFQNKPARLLMEILNEPLGMSVTQVDDLNARILSIIRTQNPSRTVVFSGNGYTPSEALMGAQIPEDDYLVGNFHSYDPWAFGGQCTRTWGSQADIDEMIARYQKVASWSKAHNIPVMINEFGVALYDYMNPENICDQNSRLAFFQNHVNLIKEFNFAASVWDDAGSFGLYNRLERRWGESKDILVGSQ